MSLITYPPRVSSRPDNCQGDGLVRTNTFPPRQLGRLSPRREPWPQVLRQLAGMLLGVRVGAVVSGRSRASGTAPISHTP